MKPYLLLLCLSGALVSGCFSQDSDEGREPPETGDPPPDTNGTTPPDNGGEDPPDNVTEFPDTIQLEGCDYWDFGINAPRALLPAPEVPEGWRTNDPNKPIADIGAYGWICQKISVGPYARGPVTFILDTHSNLDFPVTCTNDPSLPDYDFIQRVFIDDPDLQAYLNETFGMPILFASVSMEDQAAPVLEEWSWTPDGGLTSTISVPDLQTRGLRVSPEVWFWAYGEAVAQVKLDIQMNSTVPFVVETTGNFAAPMVLSEFNDGQVAGNIEFHTDAVVSGEFTIFKDTRCQEPV